MLAPLSEMTQLPRASIHADGGVEGYASLFGEIDQSRDMVMPGAFARTLSLRGVRRIPMLFQHDPSEPIGIWQEIAEDWRGLRVRGRLIPEVVRARELLALLREGAADGLSIGFKTLRAKREPGTRIRKLFEIELWEISIVTFPLLPGARVRAVQETKAPFVPAARARNVPRTLSFSAHDLPRSQGDLHGHSRYARIQGRLSAGRRGDSRRDDAHLRGFQGRQ